MKRILRLLAPLVAALVMVGCGGGSRPNDRLDAQVTTRGSVEVVVRKLAEMVRKPGLPAVGNLFASGNGIRMNPLALETIEREFGIPCTLSPHVEEAAVGAAVCAARKLAG